MKRKMLLFLLVVVMAVTPLISSACAPGPAAEEEPVKIGVLLEMTGFLSTFGAETQRGINLALDEVDHQVAGRYIKTIYEDCATDVTISMDKARKLVEVDKVDMFFGTTYSGGFMAVYPYLQKMQVPSINYWGQPVESVKDNEWMWITGNPLDLACYPMGVYAYEELGYRTASTLTANYVAGQQYMAGFIAGFEDSGGTILQQQEYDPGALDFSTYITRAETADVLAIWVTGDTVIPAFRQVEETGVRDRMPVIQIEESGLLDPHVYSEVGAAADGTVCQAMHSVVLPTAGNIEFVDAYRAAYGTDPGAYAALPYATTQIFLEALRMTNGDASREALAEAINKIELDTVRGNVKYVRYIGMVPAFIVETTWTGDTMDIELIKTYSTEEVEAMVAPRLDKLFAE